MNKLILGIAMFINAIGFSQERFLISPTIQWQKTFEKGSQANCIQQTSEGGYIAAGYMNYYEEEATKYHRGKDVLVIKLDESGKLQWQKVLGGSMDDEANSIQQTSDGGYIIAGTTNSFDGDVTDKKEENGFDYWVIKLDTSGNVQWQKVFGGDSADVAKSVQQTLEGGYIVAGSSRSNFRNIKSDGLFQGFNDENWILKLSEKGDVQWQNVFGGKGYDNPESIQQTKDKGYIIAGKSNKSVITSESDYNFSVIKLNEKGVMQWQKSLGGTNDDEAYSVKQTSDGGYIVAGTTQSIDGDVSNIPGGSQDFWVVKLNDSGDILWQKAFGETAKDFGYSIQQTEEGGYILAGCVGVDDIDGIILKLDENGTIEWQKRIGGTQYDQFNSVMQTKDKGYILAGFSNSTDGDLKDIAAENRSFWIVKLSELGKTQNTKN
jgi:hypothetical protein